jgi:outer membrane protein
MKYFLLQVSLVFILIPGFSAEVRCQETTGTLGPEQKDSLDLHFVLGKVLSSYPTVLKAQEAIHVAEGAIGLAKSGYLPTIVADAGYTRLGPVSELSIPQMGTFQIYPENNYNIVGGVYQTVYDFSKTRRNVMLEESSKEISEKNVDLVRQKLTLMTAVSYYMLVYLQEALKIRDIQLATLNEHLDFVNRKYTTGSSTQYEVLSTRVRISIAENLKVDVQTAIKTQQAILNSLMGQPVGTPILVKSVFTLPQPETNFDLVIPFALEHRNEMVIAGLKEKHSELHLKSVKAQDYPVLNAFVNGGWKNGFIPDLTKFTANYTAGIGLHVPVFDAGRRRSNIRIASAEIGISKQEKDQANREISAEVYQNEASLAASMQKIRQSELQVSQALEALSLARISFSSGSITNLDLLDSETAASESRVSLLKARVDYMIDVVRLNISIGKAVDR